MKTLYRLAIQIGLTSVLMPATFGCSAYLSDPTAAEARDQALEARAGVADANARVTAADAQVRAAEADDRVVALADGRRGNTHNARLVIPSGTLLKVFLIDAIDSNTNSPGDHFLASLAESVVIDGTTLLARGTRIRGRVINSEGAGKMKSRAHIHLDLTDIVRGNNRAAKITTGVYAATGKGNEIHYNPETRLDFTLTTSVDL